MAKRPSRSKADETAAPPMPTSAGRARGPREPGSETVAGREPDPATMQDVEPSEEEIRARAYQMYLERGGAHGLDFDDWLRAERELKNKQ